MSENTSVSEPSIAERAVNLAEQWQSKALEKMNQFDQGFLKQIQKLLNHPKDKVFLIELMDQSFRAANKARVADQIKYLFDKYGMASFFSTKETFLIHLFVYCGKCLPKISVPLFINNVREVTKSVVIHGEKTKLQKHLLKRKQEGTKVNINLIGEVVLGEDEAEERIEKYLNALANDYIDYISIKISTIYSQINVLDQDKTVEELVKRFGRIFAQAKKYKTNNKEGQEEYKFVNLDMEEYRDLEITVNSFTKTLDQDEFKDYSAGIVLQAYLPDSSIWQEKLTVWAKQRVENGGAPIKLRLVKGANMEMEETEASVKHWTLTTYNKKVDSDSNYKKMLEYALEPENAQAVHLGLASHNLFELAYGFEYAKEKGVLDYFSFEMLEGMSEAARLAIKELSGEVILYAPTAERELFTNAIAYLVRRLDENTGPENFIRYAFGLKSDSKEWNMLKEQFLESVKQKDTVKIGPNRSQNRQTEEFSKIGPYYSGDYVGEADTDFVLPANRQWADQVRAKWKSIAKNGPLEIPITVGGEDIYADREYKDVLDKSQYTDGVVMAKYTLASADDLKKAVEIAKADPDGWRNLSHDERYKIMMEVANEFRKDRADLIGVAAAELGKVFTETDVEVSEAIDFVNFYPYSVQVLDKTAHCEMTGKGVGVVVPPWNFPVAIPVGGVASALATGNTVIIKPASAAAVTGRYLCECFWKGGVSKNVLQYVPCPGSLAGQHLITHQDVDFVTLTGGEDTAYKMLEGKPDLFLTAETGGKDAMIVTALSDRDQAIKNICLSAFNNSGQKCSACSLLVLEKEVYEDRKFKKALVDTAKSMDVGSVWDFKNRIGTLYDKPAGDLEKAINMLEPGEEWALKPDFVEDNPYMLKPSIRWGTSKGQFCHVTELFGPVLTVMKAENLQDAIEIVNSTGYGLTSGLESLDKREQDYWKKHIKAGNLYINRVITGAIVLRQPFGGMGKSAIGAGRKVGIFNYATQFMNFKETAEPEVKTTQKNHKLQKSLDDLKALADDKFNEDFAKLNVALQSYLLQKSEEFLLEKDYVKVRGEDNVFKYIPVESVLVRVHENDTLFDILARILAVKVVGAKTILSFPSTMNDASRLVFENKKLFFDSNDEVHIQSDEEMAPLLSEVSRIRYAGEDRVPEYIYKEAAKNAIYIARSQPLMEGRFELLHYYLEQSLSFSYHRYGNLGMRGLDRK